jgi:hypothetical protein
LVRSDDWRALCLIIWPSKRIELGTAPKETLTSVVLLGEGYDRHDFSGGSHHGLGVWTPSHTGSGTLDVQVRRTNVAALHESSSTFGPVRAMCPKRPDRFWQSALTVLSRRQVTRIAAETSGSNPDAIRTSTRHRERERATSLVDRRSGLSVARSRLDNTVSHNSRDRC